MPEYLFPGVYVEEVSFRAKPIEGVSTSAAGFAAPARFGAVGLSSDVITNLVEFEHVYGDGKNLEFDGRRESHNYLWHSVRAFFEEGGRRLRIARVFRPLPRKNDADVRQSIYKPPSETISEDDLTVTETSPYFDGHGRGWIYADPVARDPVHSMLIRSRFPGAAGNVRVFLTLKLGQNILSESGKLPAEGLRDYDVVWIGTAAGPAAGINFYLAHFDESEQMWVFGQMVDKTKEGLTLSKLSIEMDQLRVVTLTASVTSADRHTTNVLDNIALDPNHTNTFGTPDSVKYVFSQKSNCLPQSRMPIVVLLGDGLATGLDLLQVLFAYGAKAGSNKDLSTNLNNLESTDAQRSVEVLLTGGNDGRLPSAHEYAGSINKQTGVRFGLASFEDLEDISIVATPGATANYKDNTVEATAIVDTLISHAEQTRYRIAIIDSGDNQTPSEARTMRARVDSKHAAFYYPWISVLDPASNEKINLPPSGFVAGIFVRNDFNHGVHKAPVNEIVSLATGLERMLNKEEHELLNSEGINCFRFFNGFGFSFFTGRGFDFFRGRGFRLMGAHLTSSDPEWKYVNVRRYLIYLERSIDKGTQWAVFESNGEALWANVRRTIEDFLFNEWKSGALVGAKPEEAFFVRCDRTTMTQQDLENGRLICLVGVATVRPAEFVIFRIGQWTGDRKP